MDSQAIDRAIRQNPQLGELVGHLVRSPRLVAAALALWDKVEIVDICERAGKPLNNFKATVIVQGIQIKHGADIPFSDGTSMSIEGGGHVPFAEGKVR